MIGAFIIDPSLLSAFRMERGMKHTNPELIKFIPLADEGTKWPYPACFVPTKTSLM